MKVLRLHQSPVKIVVTTIVPTCKEIERSVTDKEASAKRHGLRPPPTIMSTTANYGFWQEAKRLSAYHENTILRRTLLHWNPRALFRDLEKDSDSPARAGLRQLKINFYEESDRRVMARKKFTGGTGRVCGALLIHNLYALFRGVVNSQSFMSVISQGAHCHTSSRNI